MFPHLAKEMEENSEDDNQHRVQINSVRSNIDIEEKISGKFGTYMPDAIDFIRRCDNEKQAKEIIANELPNTLECTPKALKLIQENRIPVLVYFSKNDVGRFSDEIHSPFWFWRHGRCAR